eukprot:SAG22_NODE_710_length_7741_cov_108.460089_2_plen_209_part_00
MRLVAGRSLAAQAAARAAAPHLGASTVRSGASRNLLLHRPARASGSGASSAAGRHLLQSDALLSLSQAWRDDDGGHAPTAPATALSGLSRHSSSATAARSGDLQHHRRRGGAFAVGLATTSSGGGSLPAAPLTAGAAAVFAQPRREVGTVPLVLLGTFSAALIGKAFVQVSCMALPFCCASTVFLSKTVSFHAVLLVVRSRSRPSRPT